MADTSYTGCDIRAFATVENYFPNIEGGVKEKLKIIELGTLSAISVSTFREKEPVRVLGRSGPKGYTRGARTIAGTLAFALLEERALMDVVDFSFGGTKNIRSLLVDQIPPFDITIIYQGEVPEHVSKIDSRYHTNNSTYIAADEATRKTQALLGGPTGEIYQPPAGISVTRITGIEITTESQQHTVNDLMSENVMQYVASGYQPMLPINMTHNSIASLFNEDQVVEITTPVVLSPVVLSPVLGISATPNPDTYTAERGLHLFNRLITIESGISEYSILPISDPVYLQRLYTQKLHVQQEINDNDNE